MTPSTFAAISSVLVEKFHVDAAMIQPQARSTSSASIRWR